MSSRFKTSIHQEDGWKWNGHPSCTNGVVHKNFTNQDLWSHFFSVLKINEETTWFDAEKSSIKIAKACKENNTGEALGTFFRLEEFFLKSIEKVFARDKVMMAKVVEECRRIFWQYKNILASYLCWYNLPAPDVTNNYQVSNWKKSFLLLWILDTIASQLYNSVYSDNNIVLFADITKPTLKKSYVLVPNKVTTIKDKVGTLLWDKLEEAA